jgi:exopolyphosphatase/guanosine-5'-triphosphate,3'-diphosphate pyrophosphatase
VVDSFSRIIRLGEGVGQTGQLSHAAIDRAMAALEICRGKLERRHVRRMRLIATEACRLARNGEEFLRRVKDEVGLELEIVTQETEARLAAAGCASLIDPEASGAILFDIGGGSSELVWIDLASAKPRPQHRISDTIRSWQSLPVGVVTLSERHGGRDVDDAIFEAMVAEVTVLLDGFPDAAALDAAVAAGGIHMLGTSGTVTTLAGVYLGLSRYDRRRVDGLWMSDADVGAIITDLRQSDFEARVANPCIGQDRADLVLAGCAILEALRRRWPCERMRVADRGLREGILVELMSADGVWRRRRRRGRRRSGANGKG